MPDILRYLLYIYTYISRYIMIYNFRRIVKETVFFYSFSNRGTLTKKRTNSLSLSLTLNDFFLASFFIFFQIDVALFCRPFMSHS